MNNYFLKETKYAFLLILLLLLSACSRKEEASYGDVQVYFLSSDGTMIDYEMHDLENTDTQDQVLEILDIMSKAPDKKNLKPALSGTFSIVDAKCEEDLTTIVVSDDYKKLTPSEEVLTRAAIVRSICQSEGIEHVSMRINDEPLKDANGNMIGIMGPDQFLDNTGNEINTYERVKLHLYFADKSGQKLVPVNREITYNTNISLERLVVEQLIKGPSSARVFPLINPNTRILGVTVRDGVCYVNLNETFLAQTTNAIPEVTVYSITNSLAELPNINKVQISINGENDVNFREKIALTTIFERNLEILE